MKLVAWVVFIVAAFLEVGGDAIIRQGLRGSNIRLVVLGAMLLAFYGVTVNLVKWDFSKLLGVYVAVFAIVSVLFGHFLFKENISLARGSGLALIVLGALVMQFSP